MNQSDLPPPGGTMTVTLGLDRKVKVPMWDEDALRAYAAASVRAEREAIIQALPGGHYVDPQWVCDMIRARSKE